MVLVTSCFRCLASAPKVRWRAGAGAPALEQEPKLNGGLTGQKTGEHKHALVAIDKPWRDHRWASNQFSPPILEINPRQTYSQVAEVAALSGIVASLTAGFLGKRLMARALNNDKTREFAAQFFHLLAALSEVGVYFKCPASHLSPI